MAKQAGCFGRFNVDKLKSKVNVTTERHVDCGTNENSKKDTAMTDAYPALKSTLTSAASVFPTMKLAQVERLASVWNFTALPLF